MLDDEKLIGLFVERSEQAIGELDKKYGKLCHQLSYNIVGDRHDAEECVNDTYLGAWNAIPPAKPAPLRAFICKIARNISLTLYYKKTAAKRNSNYDVAMEELENSLFLPRTVEDEVETSELARVIEAFIDTLSIENRILFMRRYAYLDTYADIAKRLAITEKNVSV